MAFRISPVSLARITCRMMQGPGSGAGKSGGSGGSIRDAGGAFGKMEAAREDQYFHNLQLQQIDELKKHVAEEMKHTEKQIEQHHENLQKHKKRLADLEDLENKSKK